MEDEARDRCAVRVFVCFNRRRDPAGIQVGFSEQGFVAQVFRPDSGQQLVQQRQRLDVFGRNKVRIEVQIQIDQSSRRFGMLEPGCSVDLLFCPGRRDGRPVYFRDGKSRYCRQRFRGIRFALTADQFVRLFDKPADLVFAEGGLDVRNLPCSLRFGVGG